MDKPRTGIKCEAAGTYVSNCSDRAQITIPLGQVLPPCPVCKRNVDWSLVARG